MSDAGCPGPANINVGRVWLRVRDLGLHVLSHFTAAYWTVLL